MISIRLSVVLLSLLGAAAVSHGEQHGDKRKGKKEGSKGKKGERKGKKKEKGKKGTSRGDLPKEARADTPWDDLRAELSDPEILVSSTFAEWKEQCYDIFVNSPYDPDFVISGYQLYDQPSGMCMNHANCAFDACLGHPNYANPFPADLPMGFLLEEVPLEDMDTDRLNLPARVLLASSVSDVVKAVQFCNKHDIGITVKVAGHSYFGASTGRNTLLIKMTPNYPTYAIDGSLTECDTFQEEEEEEGEEEEYKNHANHNEGEKKRMAPSAMSMSCALATARGKNAVLRVGGGEMWDQAYRAVSFDWNENNANQYHILGAGRGTVSAAGGWLQSGGMSGFAGMRTYGLGIDQVLHIEMVLPDGTHVRFGPSEWEYADGFIYPKTNKAMGYCNMRPYADDESMWRWRTCPEHKNIDFDDLWYAVRGGGGGTWGIVTSLYYQLHDYPGGLTSVHHGTEFLATVDGFEFSGESAFAVTAVYVEFVMKFLYRPQDLGVSAEDSNTCASSFTAFLLPFIPGEFVCYGDAGRKMVSEWQEFVLGFDFLFRLTGIPEEVIESLVNLIYIGKEVASFAHLELSDGSNNVPEGRVRDGPPYADMVPIGPQSPSITDAFVVHFPLELLTTGFTPQLVQEMAREALLFPNSSPIYTTGGMISYAHDQMTSLSPTRRFSAFFKSVTDYDTRNHYYDIFFDALDGLPFVGDNYPGMACHNHGLIYEMGPLKMDWTVACPANLTQAEREVLCLSMGESFWGTSNLVRLESIKEALDPDRLFVCAGGVGFLGV